MAKLVEAKGKDFFLSRTTDDEAHGVIGFLKGLWVKGKELFGFDQDGNIKANNVETVGDTVVGGLLTALRSVINHAQSDNYTGGELTGTGWRLTADDGSGHSKLEVDNIVARMKFVASVLEARKYVALGGNYVYSPAASIIERVDYIKHYDEESYTGLRVEYIGAGCYEYTTNIHMVKGQTIDVTTDNAMLYVRLSDGSQFLVQGVNSVEYTATEDCDVRIGCFTADTRLNYTLESVDVILGYETLNMPWILRKMPMWMASKLMSRKKMVKTTVSDEDKRAATVFRCWIKADDGTTRTVNTWQKGMLARCQTMDVSKSENGTHTRGVNGVVSTKNTYYWREVVAALSGYLPISDGMIHSFVELSNAAGHYDAGSDLPSVGDSIVCFGATKKQYSNIIVIETVGADAPAFKEFRGVGLQDITRDNTNAELPRFSTEGRQFTKISPSTGNDFYAPHFYIETINGTEEVGYSLSRLRVDMNGIESTVTNLSNQNLLTGLADGEGWWHDESDFDASHVKFSSKGQVSVSIDGSIETPSIELPAGQYTFSCIGETAGTDYHFTVSYFENGQWYDLDDFDIEEGEDIVFTFSLTVQRIIQIEVYTDLDVFYISYPKLEYGTIATSFNMDSEVNYSRIRQTAESIEATIVNKLGETGIRIDGTHRQIQAKADQFEIQNSSGQTTMTIDDEGNIVGNGSAAFKGDIRAKNVYRASQRVSGALAPASGTTTPIGVDVEDGVSLIYIRRINDEGSYPTNFQLNLPLPSENQGRVIDIYNGEANVYRDYTKTIKVDCYIDGQRYIYPVSSTIDSAHAMPQEIHDYDHVLLFTERVIVDDSDVWVWRCLKDKVKGIEAHININGYTYNFIDGVLYNIIAP